MEGNSDPGEFVETIEKSCIERQTEIGELTQRSGIVRVAGGEHSRGGCPGFGERLPLIEDGDAESAMVEFEGEREADDAGSSDADVGTMHKISLVRFMGEGDL